MTGIKVQNRGGFRWGVGAIVWMLTCGCGGLDGESELRPDLVLVTIDTLRSDHVGAYGYARPTTPRIDALAASGVRFDRAYAQAPWTLPSMASLHTSLPPLRHGAVGNNSVLAGDVVTLAEVLRDSGYRTLGVVSHQFLGTKHGLSQGFEVFDESQIVDVDDYSAEGVTRAALAHLAEPDTPELEPFFLWVHYFDPHYTYVRHPEFAFTDEYWGIFGHNAPMVSYLDLVRVSNDEAMMARLTEADLEFIRAAYDEEIAHTDKWIGALVDGLEERFSSQPRVMVVTADHGEFFMERGRFGHGYDVYDLLVRVPLFISGSIPFELRGRVEHRAVELASLAHTLARLAGVGNPPFAGHDLLAVASGAAEPGIVFTEGIFAFGPEERKVAAVEGGWKLIHHRDDDRYELYQTDADPAETRDLWTEASPPVAKIRQRLRSAVETYEAAGAVRAPERELSADERAQLRALGYVE